ncbi:MAG TPA: sensor domain-containing diguanylate cyclase [Bradyrhizobium sp.]|nr:sensor domain-containing diguanylate cyclase [Bradyrhizobium sp.]
MNLQSAKIVAVALAESLSHQIDTTLATADSVVSSLVERVEVEGTSPESLQRLYGLMTSLAAALPAIHEIGLTDRNGNAIAKSLVSHPTGMNYSERDYFQFLSTHNTRAAFVGAPVRSKIDGSANITVSRRVNAPDGSFAGVAVTSVSVDFFRKLFELVREKSGASVSLTRDGGELLAGSPGSFGESELKALAASPVAALEYLSPNDDVYHVGAYNRLPRYSMTAMVSQDSATILNDWRSQLRVHAAIVVCILVLVAALGYTVDRANRATQIRALRDGLTNLANRRCFDEAIEREFSHARRSGQPLSLAFMDIDLFKTFNDRYGHPAGDNCLRAISASVESSLRRPSDLAARYGGEEIVLLLPATDVDGAVQIVNDILATIRVSAIRHEDSPYGIVTLSAGVACCRPREPHTSAALLVEMADAALYAAKELGRNTFAVHPNSGTVSSSSATERQQAAA